MVLSDPLLILPPATHIVPFVATTFPFHLNILDPEYDGAQVIPSGE